MTKIITIKNQPATTNEAMAMLHRIANELSTLTVKDITFNTTIDSTESIYLDRAIQCLEEARIRLMEKR